MKQRIYTVRWICFCLLSSVISLSDLPDAHAFCGFYVAKADTKLFNGASKVVMVRDGDRTVLTMANDYQGDPKEFSIVIPVPTVLEREQIHVSNNALIEHLDAYSAPRLVEYHDPDPCRPFLPRSQAFGGAVMMEMDAAKELAKSLGVTIEAEYTVGEYDIQILSAEESGGLLKWLADQGYRLPNGADATVGSYLKQGLKFFVAKVNLEEQSKLGFTYLRPLQVAYESSRYMLPIRLGTLNANGDQELFVFALTRTGRVETSNYRTVKLPEGMDVPEYLKDEFPEFYRAMFQEQVKKENGRAVFLEYAWDMGWCDPCAAEPLSNDELRELGVFWIDQGAPRYPGNQLSFAPQGQNVFLTRLHLRYNGSTFPEDLVFQTTGDRTNFQARYVMRHPWRGEATCSQAPEYFQQVRERQQREIVQLANLTGWNEESIREKVKFVGNQQSGEQPTSGGWWKKLWN
ncbi:MAG: DUF2330 domain-containing protein [Bdellovibrionales bacterium]|nr:DUF2330 domain-containing protein [Bdellovibrionales bacterium]